MKYRAEIDGLRALAVVPVILFHAGFELFSGGFVGVDVFFVISGYLITTILIEDLENQRFSLVNFYERRARRILPALFFVMLVCIPFAWMWMLPNQMKDFSQSLVAVSLFASNIFFWRESRYFAAAAEEKPLLHTWSLAVEEQYYVLFPIFLILTWRFGKNRVFWMIVVMAAISLLLSEWGWRNKASANFYLAPTRAWELFAGSIAAFIVQTKGVQKSNALALTGLAAIIFSIFFYDETTPFPSVYALLPVLGVVLLVLYADKETFAAKILSTKGFVGVGLISYSAYLWHQPLFAFARIRSLEHPSVLLMFLLSFASFVLAYLSWRYIEKPLRNKYYLSRVKVFVSSTVLLASFTMIGLVSHFYNPVFEDKYFRSLSDEQRELYLIKNFAKDKGTEFISKWRYGSCFYGSEINTFSAFKKDVCLAQYDARKNVLLMGDSHAAHWYFAIKQNYPNINLMQATASGCRPLKASPGAKRCTDLMEYAFDIFLPQSGVDTVILAARWDIEEAKSYLKPTIAHLHQLDKNVIVIGPVIEFPGVTMIDQLMRFDIVPNIQSEEALKYADLSRLDVSNELKRLLVDIGVKYIEIANLQCNKNSCALTTDDAMPYAFDYGHLTLSGSNQLIKRISSQLSFE